MILRVTFCTDDCQTPSTGRMIGDSSSAEQLGIILGAVIGVGIAVCSGIIGGVGYWKYRQQRKKAVGEDSIELDFPIDESAIDTKAESKRKTIIMRLGDTETTQLISIEKQELNIDRKLGV